MRRSALIFTLVATGLIGVAIVNLSLGSVRIPPVEMLQALLGQGKDGHEFVLFQLRLPRLILAVLIGAGLGVAGAILQAVTQNDIAEPGILGINTGAGLGVVLFILFVQGNTQEALPSLTVYMIPLSALAGGMLAAIGLYVFAWKQGFSPLRLLLVGIAVNAALSAILILFQLRLDFGNFQKATIWLSGSIWISNWDYVLAMLPWSLLILYTMYHARTLDVFRLGDEAASGLGMSIHRARSRLLFVAIALTGSSVAAGGGIAFVGLIAPHLVKRLLQPAHRWLVPGSAMMGALLVSAGDTIGKHALPPSEIPVGLVVGMIGVPYFVYLLMKLK